MAVDGIFVLSQAMGGRAPGVDGDADRSLPLVLEIADLRLRVPKMERMSGPSKGRGFAIH